MPKNPPDIERTIDSRERKKMEASVKRKGHLFVVSAPSGTGKTTLCREMLRQFERLIFSISFTTRQPRPNEKHGVDYFFISVERFKEGITSGQWAEYARVYDNYYGTSKEFLQHHLLKGNDVLLDIDVQGADQIVAHYPDSVTIFIMPPSVETLKHRLESRDTDDKSVICKRLAQAEQEMAHKEKYRHIIVNDHLPDGIRAFAALIERYREK